MKKEYDVGGDIFLVVATMLVGAAIVLKIFGVTFSLGFTLVTPQSFLKLGVVTLLFSMALNLQDLVHK